MISISLLLGLCVMTSTSFSHTLRKTERVRFLSADITLHANLNNALFSICQAEHIAKVLEIDQPWEKKVGFDWVMSLVCC